MEKVTFTRKELYDLVWKQTMSSLSKKYALSDNGFRKLCVRMDIPIPKNGYWQKINFNKPVTIDKLPIEFKGDDKIELIIREEGSQINYDNSPLIQLTKEIQNDPKAPLIVPDNLIKPDILVLQTKQYWNKKKKDLYYRDETIDILPIYVENINKDRALRFMDTLIKLLKYRGHYLKKGKYGSGTVVVIDSIEIRIDLREATKRIPGTKLYESSTYIPTGEFILQIGKYSHKKEWRDGKSLLEDILARIVAKLELYAEREKEWEEQCRINQIKREKEEAIRKIFLEQKQKELSSFKQLLINAERLDKTTKLRNYIKIVEENALINNSLDEELKEWIVWAKNKVDWYDPLIRRKDDFLSDYDISDLDEKKLSPNNYYRY